VVDMAETFTGETTKICCGLP